MSISQFNGTWSNKEDRIELRFNTSQKEEFCFWVTRFMALQFIALTDSVMENRLKKSYENERTAEVVQEFQKEQLKSSADFTGVYEGGDIHPAGSAPILLIGLSLTPQDEIVDVQFQLENKMNVNFQVSHKMLNSLALLLETLAKNAGWLVGQGEVTLVADDMHSPAQSLGNKKSLH